MPWLVRALAARTFESFCDVELVYIGGGRRKHRESIRRCTGWNKPGGERSSGEDWTAADACWATEDGSVVNSRTGRVVRRAVRRTFEWWRRKSSTRRDEHREAYEANSGVRRHNLPLFESCWSCLME